jgi:hypothetical protein
MFMRHTSRILFGAVMALAGVSCGDVARTGRSPVYLVIDLLQASRGGPTEGELTGTLQSDVLTFVTEPAPCSEESPCPTVFSDSGSAIFRIVPKDITSGLEPTTNNEVTITRYRIDYRRSDGRNTPGVDVPYGFDGAATGTVPAGSNLVLEFELVRHVSKQESPLVQLATSSRIISTIAEITFYGRDRVGNEISATGSMLVDFGNFGD